MRERLRSILRLARSRGAFVNIDMEQFAFKDLTIRIFQEVLEEEEFRGWGDVGIAMQAYLRSCGEAHVRGDTLVATCRRADGNAERTSLPAVQRCVGDIGNMNGRLTCSYAGAPTPPQPYYGEPRGGAPDYGGYAPPSYGGYAPPGYGR